MDIFNQMEKTKTTATGRKKIEIKELDKYPNKQVTFSKRRAGLFKKASELCILCNAQVAVIVFSPADKAFCFGQPNAETVITRYLRGTADSEPKELRGNSSSYEEHNKQYEEAKKVLDLEKKQLVKAEIMAKVSSRENWWKEPIDQINLEQLKQYTMAMIELRRNVAAREEQLMMRSFYGARPFVAAAAVGDYSGFVNHLGDKMF